MRGTVPPPARQSMRQTSSDLIVDPGAPTLGQESSRVQLGPTLPPQTRASGALSQDDRARSKPTENNVPSSHWRSCPPSTMPPGGTPTQYSDLVARISRMEDLQHSKLLTIDKVCECVRVCVSLCVCG